MKSRQVNTLALSEIRKKTSSFELQINSLKEQLKFKIYAIKIIAVCNLFGKIWK